MSSQWLKEMKKKAIFSQVTAVLELDFYQQLELLTDINDVQQKLLREVSQTCVLHTSSSDTWLIQGCLDGEGLVFKLFVVI